MRSFQSVTALIVVLFYSGMVYSELDQSVELMLGRALQNLVTMQNGPPGAIAIIQRGSKITAISRGVSNLISGRKILMQDHMRIASTSKAFSGAVALSLVDRGMLSLEDRIAVLLPELPAAWGAVTLRQALNHTSGLLDFTKDPEFLMALGSDPHKIVSPRRLLKYVENEPLMFSPGSRYLYSNSDNIVVGLMAEAATNLSYERLLQLYVFDPLVLKKTSLPADFVLPNPYIRGYDIESPQPPEDISTVASSSWVWASGGLVSTPHDMNRFIRGYVGRRLFDRVVQDEQFRFFPGGGSEPPGPGKNSAGLAVFRYQTRCGTVYGHTGNFPGYTQFIAATRDLSASVVVSVNEQLNEDTNIPVFEALLHAEELAVCLALDSNS